MHNQENCAEDDLYITGNGAIAKLLNDNLGNDFSFFRPSGKSALDTILYWLPVNNPLLLVHNIYTRAEDIEVITRKRAISKTWFVLCPNSNLYIEDRLPDINLFHKKSLQICVGTDSLSSNHQLSVLEEIKTIQEYFPQIPLAELITWSTLNGAKALGIDSWAGTIEKGKKPGINLVEGMDLQNMQLLPPSKVRRLV
jgi:cytosine/adenosine deaminase-related metal-dependent hydrolase